MKKGFTLIEILVSLVIMSIVIGGLFMVLNIADLNWSLGGGLLGLQQQVRQAMDGMVRELRQSRSSNVTITGGTNIQFCIPIDITPAVTYSDWISYYVSSGQLFREHPMGSDLDPDRMANDIDSVTFCWCHGATCATCNSSRDDGSGNLSNLVRIQLFASKTVRQKLVSFSLTEKVKLRNE